MSHIHVCLVSAQPIPNLTTSLQFRPERVVLLTTREMKERAGMLGDVLRKRGIAVDYETIGAYDIDNVTEVCERVIRNCGDCKITLNITGGTKIGTLGSFRSFYTAGKPIYYVDTKNHRIMKVFPEKDQDEQSIDVSIPVRDYLSAYGFRVESSPGDDGHIFRRKELTAFLAGAPDIVKELNYKLHEYGEESPVPVRIKIGRNDRLLKLLGRLDGVSAGSRMVKINDPGALRYLKGCWLEEYVYMTAKALKVDEVLLNVTGRWITSARYKPKNEFDVLISKGTRLFLISCKTANPNRREGGDEGIGREFLYELDSLADNALGLFGKRMLASSRRIEDPYVRERARVLNIDVVDGKNIITLKENLRQWLQE